MIKRYNETYVNVEPISAISSADEFFYPNPANDVIQLQKGKYQNISIYTIEGSLVQSYSPPFVESLNISSIKPGMYIIVAQTTNGILRQKLLKK